MRACVCCICTSGTRPARTAAPTNGCRCVTTSRRPSQEGSAAARRAAVCLRDMAADTAGQQQLFHSYTSCFRFTPSSFIVAGALLTFPIFIFFNNSPKSKSRTLSGFQFSVDSPHTLTHDEPRSDLFMAGMKRAPPLLCCRDIVNFFMMFAAALVVCLPQFCLPPRIPVYFQAIGCCLVVIKRSSSVEVLLFLKEN